MKTRILIVTLATIAAVIFVACAAPPLPAPTPNNAQGSTTNGSKGGAGVALDLGPGAQVAIDRIGVQTLKPAAKLDQPNVARDPSDLPAPIHRTEPTTVKVKLEIKEVTAEIAPGATYSFWTFGGTVPGPMIRVMEGDTVELTLSNPATSTMPHNIDLHAVNGPGGGAAVTTVAPGESKTFTFKALNAGVFVYHCAYAPPYYHMAQGMYGAILVEPKGGLPPVDREF